MAAWIRGLRRLLARLLLGLAVLSILLLVFVTQTPIGREWVLREVLARVSGGINGSIEVDGVSSPGLLNGFTFRGVAIRGKDGGIFLRADSIRTGISGPALLRGDVILTGVHLWRPRIFLEQLTRQEPINAEAIFLRVPPPDSTALSQDSLAAVSDSLLEERSGGREGPRRTILLRNAEIHDGDLNVLLPLPSGERELDRILVEPASEGRPSLRRLSFRNFNLELGQATLRAPGQQGERFEVRNLSFLGEVWPDPIRVTGARGELRREGKRLLASLTTFDLTNSSTQGQVDVRWGDGAGPRVSVDGRADPLALEDLFPIESRLPTGTARGPFGFDLDDDGILLDFRGTELTSELGRINARGGLFLGRDIAFRDLAMELTELDLAVTDPWVVDTLALRGRMTGQLSLAGNLDELEVLGLVDLTDPDSIGVVTADIRGRMGFRDGFTASSLDLTLAPLEWGTFASVSPAMTLRGPGRVGMTLNGSLWGDGLRIDDAEFTHIPIRPVRPLAMANTGQGGVPAVGRTGGVSRVTLSGSVRRTESDLFLNLTGGFQPLSLTALRQSFPILPLEGEYAGTVELRGPVSDLETTADLETSGGPITVRARFDARRVADSYSFEATAEEDFVLSNLLPALPDPTTLSGTVFAEGRGLSLDALEGDARIAINDGLVGHLRIDSVFAEASVQEGVLSLREFISHTEAGSLEASGFFGVASDAPPGELAVTVTSESLEPLRPFLMDLPTRTREEILSTELEVLDPDTFPSREDIVMAGSVHGAATLRGGFKNFSGDGSFELQGLRFRRDYVGSATLTVSADNLPGIERRVRVDLSADSLGVRSLAFREGTAELDLRRSEGRVRVIATRSSAERYSGQGTYTLESGGGGTLNLDELTVDFDSVQWNLGGPATFSWSPEGYRIRDFRLIRPGLEYMRFRADGFLPLAGGGESDLTLEAERFNLGRLAQLLQMDTPLEGMVDFQGRMTGPSGNPSINGEASGQNLRYGEFSLDQVNSVLGYQDLRVNLDLQAEKGGQQVLSATGFFPLDLRIDPESSDLSEAPVDLRVSVDSFPAAIALAFIRSMQQVEGTVSGDLRFQGTAGDLEPRGELFLRDGSALHPGLGVRHRGVQAHLVLTPDGVVEVDGTLESEGTASVTGTVILGEPLSNPELNLAIQLRNFLAVNRRDFIGRLSGTAGLSGEYERPVVTGDLRVERGELMVEEVARSVEVLDLSNPGFLNVVDTMLVALRPVIQASQNPFLQNLVLRDMKLTMAQDSWLRGRQLNLEMAGTLDVYWDRKVQNITFVGVLDAVRGTYSVFSRQFQVEEGTVSFAGVPGINPDLSIRAINRLRTQRNEQLEIIATVGGSLLEPRVSLSGNSSFPIPEDDLVSYLIFGQPAYALGSGQRESAGQGADALRGAGANLAVGLFSSELGAILTRDLGVDYLAVTQGASGDFDSGERQLAGAFLSTQVEIGQYLSDDIFVALQWRPLGGAGGSNLRQLAAFRVESRLWDNWILEAYMEDRFLQNSLFLLGNAEIDSDNNRGLRGFFKDYSKGFFLYRQWGY